MAEQGNPNGAPPAGEGEEQYDGIEMEGDETFEEALQKGDLVILDEDEIDREGEEGEEGEGEDVEDAAREEGAMEVEDMGSAHFTAHDAPVYAVAIGKSGPATDLILTGGGDDRAILWDTKDDSASKMFECFEESVNVVQFSEDGSFFAAGTLDGVVRVFDTSKRELVATLEGPAGDVEWVKWHKKGPVLAAGYGDSTVWLWNIPTQRCMQVFTGHDDSVAVGDFTADGKALVTGSLDGSVRVWDPKSGNCIHAIMGRTFHHGSVISMQTYHDESQQLILSGGEDNAVCLSHSGTGKILGKLQYHKDAVTSVHFVQGLPFASSGCVDGQVVIWDLTSLKPRQTFIHEGGVTSLHTHARMPSVLFSAGVDGAVKLWDVRTAAAEPQKVFTGHLDAILCMDISADASYIATSSDDRTARLFDLRE